MACIGERVNRCAALLVSLGLAVLIVCTLAPNRAAAAILEAPTARLIESARSTLREYLGGAHPELSRLELDATGRVPAPFATRAARVAWSFSVRGGPLSRRMCVWVTARGADQETAALPIWFAVKAYQWVWVSRQARAAHQPLRVDDLSLEERDVAPLGAMPLGSDVDVTTRRLRRALAVNRIVLRGAVEDVPPISQGEDVAVRVHSGAVEIQTRAVALQDGRLGELVKLENPTSHATFTAQVIGEQQVLVNAP